MATQVRRNDPTPHLGDGSAITPFYNPHAEVVGGSSRQTHDSDAFHTVGSKEKNIGQLKSSLRPGIFDPDDFDESGYAGEFTRTYTPKIHSDSRIEFVPLPNNLGQPFPTRASKCKRCDQATKAPNKVCEQCQRVEEKSQALTYNQIERVA